MDKKAKILIVDDEEKNAKLLDAILIPEGYETTISYCGDDALEKAVAGDFNIILSDVMMPGMDGFEVTRQLRSDIKTRLVPIVLVTALKETEDRIKGIEAGCDDFISKPFDKNEVLARVQTLLKLDFYRRQLGEKDKFERVIQEMDEGVIVCDSNLNILEINNAAKKFLYVNEPQRFSLPDLLYNHYTVSIERDHFQDEVSGGKRFDLVRDEQDNIKALYLESNIQYLKDASGKTVYIVATLRDVTAQRKEELIKQDFMGLVSHKLMTPISVISGNMSMLYGGILGELSKEQKDCLNAVSRQISRLKEVLEKLLAFSVLKKQNVSIEREDIAVKPFIIELVGEIKERFSDKEVIVNVDCIDEASISIHKVYFELILDNLIENGIKFNGKDKSEVNVSVCDKGNDFEFIISDNGPGIPSEEQEKIFDAFYQVEKHFTGNVMGVGLGLASVKRIVEFYEREIELQTELGKGATFKFSLPKE